MCPIERHEPTRQERGLMNESTRAYIYRVLLAVVPVLTARGIVSDSDASLIVALAAAILGIGLAVHNTSTKP